MAVHRAAGAGPCEPPGRRPVWEGSDTTVSMYMAYDEACAKYVSEDFSAQRILLIASRTLSRESTRVSVLQRALGDRLVYTRYGMQSHTLWSEVLELVAEARRYDADLILTIGGGSLTDAAKVISLALANNATTFEDLHRLHSGQNGVLPSEVPIITVPTTLSGGDFRPGAGATNDIDKRKYSFTHPIKGPALAIIDFELATSTPDRWWFSSGVRAIDHCVETLCSLKCNEQAERKAMDGLWLMPAALLECRDDRNDLVARESCFHALMAAMEVIVRYGVPMGASHGIGHQLGPLGVAHGDTSAILLPAVCKFNASANASRQQIATHHVLWAHERLEQLFNSKGIPGDAPLWTLLDVLFRAFGLPRSLREVGVKVDDPDVLDKLAENSLHDRNCQTNPIPLTEKKQVLEILELCKERT